MERDRLVSELKVAFNRPLAKVFSEPGEEDKFPLLAHICRVVEQEKWVKSGRPYARYEVTRAAIQSLPDEKPKGCEITWRQIGMTLSGLRGDLPVKDGGRGDYGYKDYYKILKSESGIPEIDHDYKLRRVIVERFYEHLADALLKLERQAIEGGADVSESDREDSRVEENETPYESSSKGRSHSSSDRIIGLFNIVVHGSASVKTKISGKAPNRRRKRVLLVASASVVAILLIGFVGVRLLSDGGGGDGDPLDISLAWSGNPSAMLLAFPDSEKDAAIGAIEEANASSDARNIGEIAVEAGAYYVSQMEIHILLSGESDEEVRVTNLRPVFKNPPTAAASGLLLRAIGAGGDDISNMQFVLDETNPVAREWFPGSSLDPREGSPFFQSQSISVPPDQERTVVAKFNAYWGAFDFEVAIDYQVGGEEYSHVLSNEGQAQTFRVSGVACPQDPTELGLSENGGRNEDVRYSEVWESAPPEWTIKSVEAEGYCEMWQEAGWRPE
ncbi:hypothetical protein [Nocardiopsis sp. FR4]|uniref:hypothetical protein n=1 Tax=Nocardiopsis sp. FR4 TaxID=2605985 RepID=UPI00135BC446|nr:hypothetical protein [Nocardiopsis sp. FR4]